jgi:hypothetical protein
VQRDYHSVAWLMSDGRVWTAGSNINGQQSFVYLPSSDDQDPSVDMRERRIEIFEPDYFSRPDRPHIDSAPRMVSHAQTFHVSSADATAVARIAILRTGTVTHSYKSDQRYIVLDFRRSGETELEVVGRSRRSRGRPDAVGRGPDPSWLRAASGKARGLSPVSVILRNEGSVSCRQRVRHPEERRIRVVLTATKLRILRRLRMTRLAWVSARCTALQSPRRHHIHDTAIVPVFLTRSRPKPRRPLGLIRKI